MASLDTLLTEIRGCRICRDSPAGRVLPHEPRPVVRVAATARIAICGQAPGVRVHNSGLPFDDPSGDRLRDWMGIERPEFYDPATIAFLPMGFCFPGHDSKKGDLPPRRECAPVWRTKLLAELAGLELVLLIGQYAQAWHLPRIEGLRDLPKGLTATIADWRRIYDHSMMPRMIMLPHPSWRNSGSPATCCRCCERRCAAALIGMTSCRWRAYAAASIPAGTATASGVWLNGAG
jgi:uracil-DNA glycosylase